MRVCIRQEDTRRRASIFAERYEQALHGRPVLERTGAMGDWMGECVLDSV